MKKNTEALIMNKEIEALQIKAKDMETLLTTDKDKEALIMDKDVEALIVMNEEIETFLALPKNTAIKVCMEWNKEVNGGKVLKTDEATQCPIYQWVIFNNAKCHREMVPNTAVCPLCGRPVCPDCMNHNVDIISRVTGYLSTVSGWNTSKKQEFEDRNRYNLDVMGRPATNVNR